MNHRAVPKKTNSFGRRAEPHTITITKGSKTRVFRVKPAHFVGICGVVGTLMLSYLGATAYLVLRDDLIGSTLASQAKMQQGYEGRIAALRSKLDLITSQQLLEQQAVEYRVKQLIERQNVLGSRTAVLGAALQKAANNGLTPASTAIPKPRPYNAISDTNGSAPVTTGSLNSKKKLQLGALSGTSDPFNNSTNPIYDSRSGNSTLIAMRDANGIIANVENSLVEVETRQISTLMDLRNDAVKKTRKIAGILSNIGVSLPKDSMKNVGGPFIEPDDSSQFQEQITALDVALGDLENARLFAANLPIGSPAAGRSVSSRFGPRIDPFKRRTGIHSGVDLRAPMGFPVLATGGGKVVKAGRNGGYGLMVEIVHGNGLVTRYAHMSKVRVKVGDIVKTGRLVGNVGSTGRSTGPHLHYEVRFRGKPQNPGRYVKAGAKLKSLL